MLRYLTVVVLGLGLASPSLAQGLPDPVLGALVPDSQVAAVSDGFSFLSNPAGLAGVDRLQLGFGYSGVYVTAPQDHFHLGLSSRLLDNAVVGGQLGWVVAAPGTRRSLFRSTAALGIDASRAARFGVQVHGLTELRPGASTDVLWDLGMQLRPTPWLSLGATLESLGAVRPIAPGARVGLSLRPFKALTVGADARFTGGSDDLISSTFIDGGRVTPAVNARLQLGGIGIGAAASYVDALGPTPDLEFGVSLTVDTAHVGATLLGGYRVDDQLQVGAFGRVSAEAFDSVFAGEGEWLGFTLSGRAVPSDKDDDGLLALFAASIPPERMIAAFDRAARDPAIEGVVLRLRGLSIGWGRATELRRAIARLRAAGKRVVVHLDSGSDRDLYIAVAADQIFVSPAASLAFDGLRVEMIFFNEMLEKLGIEATAFVAGDYKSGPRSMTHNAPNDEQLEVQNALLDVLYGALVGAISDGRGIQSEAARALLDRGGLTPAEAIEAKLVDGTLYIDEVEEHLESKLGHEIHIDRNYLDREERDLRWADPSKIAIIPIVGEIRRGGSGDDLLSGQVAGADSIIAALNRAGRDSSIDAVVLRIDSPGGDALASDLIWHAVRRLRAEKPVVASMGDVAASGGYYIAAGADHIYAEPETITGSIGVYAVHMNGSRAADQVGVSRYELKRGALPGGTLLRPFTEEESARAQEQVEAAYARFLTAVREGRTISQEDLEAAASGRVWMGAKAKELGLVDKMGGVLEAIADARARAETPDAEVVVMTTSGGGFSPLDLATRVLGGDQTSARRALELLLGDLDGLGALGASGAAPQARMPATLRVE